GCGGPIRSPTPCSKGPPRQRPLAYRRRATTRGSKLSAFQLRDEKNLGARSHGLVVADILVDLAVDGDRGLVLQVVAESRLEPVDFLEDAAKVLGLDRELLDAAGIAPTQATREHYARGSRHAAMPRRRSPPIPCAATSGAP